MHEKLLLFNLVPGGKSAAHLQSKSHCSGFIHPQHHLVPDAPTA